MGICTSSGRVDEDNHMKTSANVVSIGGDLRQYPVPITVSQVLQSEFTSPSSPSSSSAFLCNSDSLYFDDYIPALSPNCELEPCQIYFVLPASKLQYRLSASDMAALAVKASLALESQKKSTGRKKKRARISPLLVEVEQREQEAKNPIKSHYHYADQSKKKSSGPGVSRSGSLTKMQRYSSRRAKFAVRSFRIKLSTIYEGSILVFN